MGKHKKAILALILANTIWGAGAPIFKWAFEAQIHPFTLAFFRFLIPTLILGFLYRKKLQVKIKDFPKILLAGFFAISINVAFFFIGIEKTISINAPIIASSEPLFLILGSIFFLRERPGQRVFLGNMLGLTGVLLIIIEPLIQINAGGSVLGNFLLVISLFGSVVGAILSKKLLKIYDPFTIAFWAFFVGLISFLPFFVSDLFHYGLVSQISLPTISAIAFGGIFSSLIGYGCYYWGLKYISASETSVFAYIDPIAGILIAAPLVHEYPNTFFLFGAVLVFFGVFIAEGRIHYHPFHKLFA